MLRSSVALSCPSVCRVEESGRLMRSRVAPRLSRRLRVNASGHGMDEYHAKPGKEELRSRRGLLGAVGAAVFAASYAAPAPNASAGTTASQLILDGSSPVVLSNEKCKAGFRLDLPASWVLASDRDNTGNGALTLLLVGDFKTFDTARLMRRGEEALPPT